MEFIKSLPSAQPERGQTEKRCPVGGVDRSGEVDRITIKEYHELLRDTQEHPIWNLLIQIMVLSGMRFGEAAALHKEDVELDRGVIHVRRSYDSQNRKETAVKSQTSARDIFIQPQLAEALRQMQTQMRLQQMRTKVASKYFMSGEDGEPVHYWVFNKFLKYHTDRVCGRQLTTHALRHTASMRGESIW